jgi:hypothetical protein
MHCDAADPAVSDPADTRGKCTRILEEVGSRVHCPRGYDKTDREAQVLSTEQVTRTLPDDRYGSARGAAPRRWRIWVYGLIALAVSGTVAYVAYRNLGAAPIDAQQVGFSPKANNSMEITIDVTRDDPSRPGVCIVYVQDVTGAESGRKEILVPPGGASRRMSTVIRSIGKPVTASVFGCSYVVPRYLSTS